MAKRYYKTTDHLDLTPILIAMKDGREMNYMEAGDLLKCHDLNAFQYMAFLEEEGLITGDLKRINPNYRITPSGLAQIEINAANGEGVDVPAPPRPRFK